MSGQAAEAVTGMPSLAQPQGSVCPGRQGRRARSHKTFTAPKDLSSSSLLLPPHGAHPHLWAPPCGKPRGCGEDPRLLLPLLLCHDQLGQVGVQLVLLVDPLLLDAVPAFLLGDAQRAGDVVPKVQPLLLGEVGDGLVVALHLHLALPQEEMRLDRLPVQLQRPLAVRQRLVVLLHLQVAQRPVGVVHGHQGVAVLWGMATPLSPWGTLGAPQGHPPAPPPPHISLWGGEGHPFGGHPRVGGAGAGLVLPGGCQGGWGGGPGSHSRWPGRRRRRPRGTCGPRRGGCPAPCAPARCSSSPGFLLLRRSLPPWLPAP
uniref:Uncharacterized protein n=1 Tax=Anas platyrhynchos platyrhynchos TaxID=8840 RepID=A0A493SY31_ANAPP